ncbi:MAG: ABC transporter ATP-binding protein [Acutalibacteraceae bacterium]
MDNKKVMIKFDNVSKEYLLFKNDRERFKSLFFKPKNAKRHKALNNVSLEIYDGESVGIIGDNGAGKSTLLKMITGVAFPDSGDIVVNGTVAALLELTAGFALEMSGRENIYLRGYTLGLKDNEIKEIEDKIVDFAELGDYIDQPVRTYSSGMKMRLGFAINVNINPDILVIDEALSVGDATFKKKCTNRISEIIKSGTTVLYVSHSQNSVKEMCTRAIYLKKGEVKFAGNVNDAFKVYEADKATKKK